MFTAQLLRNFLPERLGLVGAETRPTSGIWRVAEFPSHQMGIAPDGKTLWVNSKVNSTVYGYSLCDLKLLGGIPVHDHPD